MRPDLTQTNHGLEPYDTSRDILFLRLEVGNRPTVRLTQRPRWGGWVRRGVVSCWCESPSCELRLRRAFSPATVFLTIIFGQKTIVNVTEELKRGWRPCMIKDYTKIHCTHTTPALLYVKKCERFTTPLIFIPPPLSTPSPNVTSNYFTFHPPLRADFFFLSSKFLSGTVPEEWERPRRWKTPTMGVWSWDSYW